MIHYPSSTLEIEFLRQWLQKRVPDLNIGNDSVCLGVWRGKGEQAKLVAVAGFYNYRHVDIEISFAADDPRWASKQTITWILGYPFHQLKTQRVTAMVAKSNHRCRKLLRGAGFTEEGRHKHAGKNLETIFSYGLTREDYLKRYPVIGQKEPAKSAAAG